MRARACLSLGLIALAGSAAPLPAQGIADLLASIRDGGGWIAIPVTSGQGRLLTGILPTVGLHVAGCAQVWGGHSGQWEIRAHDTQGGGSLEMNAGAGDIMRFEYTTGLTARLDVGVRWSEPRDTTLLLWVGLEGPKRVGEDACEPSYTDSVRPRGSEGDAWIDSPPQERPNRRSGLLHQ